MGTQLTTHFTLEEMTFSETAIRKGIVNEPNNSVLENLLATTNKMETLRGILGNLPIKITSGFRSLDVNSAIGGSGSSAHVRGLAVDFQCPEFGSPKKICQALLGYHDYLDWDQLIHEGGWVHIGWRLADNRGQVLTADFSKKPTGYLEGIV